MILTTTPGIQGKNIVSYQGIVFGEVISGVNFLKDFTAGLRNFFGGRSASYEEEPVSYTHLDVYKRQGIYISGIF